MAAIAGFFAAVVDMAREARQNEINDRRNIVPLIERLRVALVVRFGCGKICGTAFVGVLMHFLELVVIFFSSLVCSRLNEEN